MTDTLTLISYTPRVYGRKTLPTKADFKPLDRKPDTSRNAQRGARKSNRKTRTIL